MLQTVNCWIWAEMAAIAKIAEVVELLMILQNEGKPRQLYRFFMATMSSLEIVIRRCHDDVMIMPKDDAELLFPLPDLEPGYTRTHGYSVSSPNNVCPLRKPIKSLKTIRVERSCTDF